MVIMMKRPWDSEVGGVTLQRRIEKAVILKSPKHKLSQMRDTSRGNELSLCPRPRCQLPIELDVTNLQGRDRRSVADRGNGAPSTWGGTRGRILFLYLWADSGACVGRYGVYTLAKFGRDGDCSKRLIRGTLTTAFDQDTY